jgi:hypothetical protein
MIAEILTLVATVATAAVVIRARGVVQHTTLRLAWTWSTIAALAWCIAAGASLVGSSSVIGQLWYVAAVVTLCPWIAVLGARRPTVRVWNWFVVLPLLAVLLWPVALCWMPRGPDRLALAAPHVIGFALVLVMGTGNYLGTRFTGLAVLTCMSEGLLLMWLTTDAPSGERPWLAAVPAIVLFQGVLTTISSKAPRRDSSGWNRLWVDFCNTFGIVWANRIAERVNAEAAKAHWTVRLQPQGFVSADPAMPADLQRNASQIDHTMRWLLRRFVDDEWIDRRLQAQVAPGLNDGGSLAGNDSIEASSTWS